MGIADIASELFEACETGKGWEGCAQYCHANASFSCQSDALADVTTMEGYANWMRDLLMGLSSGRAAGGWSLGSAVLFEVPVGLVVAIQRPQHEHPDEQCEH